MKKILVSMLLLTAVIFETNAQKYYTKNGSLAFYSKTAMENIDATNNQALSVLTLPSGDLQFSALIKSFHFQKALMEEHFNESYLESDKFPKATFKGKITDASKIDVSKDGSYNVTASGDITIHGITKAISTPATITVKGGKISANAEFNVKLADHKVKSHANVSETVKVTVNCNYDKQ